MSDTDLKWEATRDHRDIFAKIFARLAATRSQAVDEVKVRTYWQTLGDLPLIGVKEAAAELAKKPGGWFPSAGDWFTLAVARSDQLWASRIPPHLPGIFSRGPRNPTGRVELFQLCHSFH